MKAVICPKYGPPEVLQICDFEKPVPTDTEILIKVHAATVTAGDVNVRTFNFPKLFWLFARIGMGIRGPKKQILGVEFAGEVESVGKNVTKFKKDDLVFGSTEKIASGAYAEYICMPEDGLVTKKPANLTCEQAAVVPVGGRTALFFLQEMAKIQKGQKILIIGASGSIGTYAVQLAKHFGAQVTGVCSTANVDLVRSLGADKVVDYIKDDFTQNGETYDIIFDTVTKSTFSRSKNSLNEDGLYLATYPTFAIVFQMLWTSLVGSKKAKFGGEGEKLEDLVFLKELIEKGTIKPVIDRTYPLEQIVEAHRYVEQGHKKGNVIISLNQKNEE